MSDTSDDDDKVGYKKPPKAHRFVKGVSGNPKGRRPRSKQMDSLIDRELDELVTMKEAGAPRRLRKREAIVKRLVNGALSGNVSQVKFLIAYCREHGAPDPFEVTAEDEAAMKAYARQLASETPVPNATQSGGLGTSELPVAPQKPEGNSWK